jgi:Type I restriction modification DNA specificity domain
MIKVLDLFDVRYGASLELNNVKLDPDGVNFVSRSARNNGVTARVALLPDIVPSEAGTITVAGGGSVMESFLQPEPYYSGFHLFCLTALQPLTDSQKLYYCACLRANKYRYSYGRQANRTLRDILIPAPDALPDWVGNANPDELTGADLPASKNAAVISDPIEWQPFYLNDLFDLRKGQRLTKADMLPGNTPFIGAVDKRNGVTNFVSQAAQYTGNVLTVNYNGNGVAEAFYQPVPFRASDDVNVLLPKFKMTPAIGLFIASLIRLEKYRFNYGRKWHLERMAQAEIRLPVTAVGVPNWEWIESYIKTLPFSSQL